MSDLDRAWHVMVVENRNWKLYAYWLKKYAPKLEVVS